MRRCSIFTTKVGWGHGHTTLQGIHVCFLSSPLLHPSLPPSLPLPAGTILHFPDASLQSTYFLDPQWLTKMMANFIGPPKTAKGKEPLIQDG